MASKTIFIHAKWYKHIGDNGGFTYFIHDCDMAAYGYVLLEVREIEFQTPIEREIKLQQAKALTIKKNKILADAYVEAQGIQQEADELLALENKSDE